MDAVDAARKIAKTCIRRRSIKGQPVALCWSCLGEAAKRNIVVYALPPDDPQLKGGQAVFAAKRKRFCMAERHDFDRAFSDRCMNSVTSS